MKDEIIDYGPTSSRNFEESQPLPLLMAPGNIQTRAEARTSAPTTRTSGFTPHDIIETYEVLAPMATDYANANLERAGQAQASYGPLAQAAMGDSQTAGVGNYTYNRLVRPAVDTLRDQLIVEGYSNSLNKQLSDSLNAARNNYNRATRRRNNNPDTTGGGQTKIKGHDDVDSGAGSTKSPMVLYNTFTITDADGKSRVFSRPEAFKDDLVWYKWAEYYRKKAESEGKTFKYGS